MEHSWTLTIIHFLEPIIFILNIFNFIIKSQNIIDDASFVFPGSLKYISCYRFDAGFFH